MPMLEVTNRAYQERVETAMIEAIVSAVRSEDGATATLLSGEIVQACLNIAALMAGTSKATDTPRRTREFAEECGATIRRRVAAVREKRAAGGLDFMTIVHADERH